jgi:transposase
MRKIIEILRLKHEHGLSVQETSRSCGLAHSTVRTKLIRLEAAQLDWPLPPELSEADLLARSVSFPQAKPSGTPSPVAPNCAHIHAELRCPNLTLRLLSREYIRTEPNGLKYSRICERH